MKSTFHVIILVGVFFLLGCAGKDSMVRVSDLSSEIEVVPEQIGRKIKESLNEFSTMKQYPEGFGTIEDVKLDWISIAGLHTRKATFEDLFLFPHLNTSIEKEGWNTGLAFRKNSPIVYTWKLKD